MPFGRIWAYHAPFLAVGWLGLGEAMPWAMHVSDARFGLLAVI
ncbi:MAG: hypothetical protein QNI90_13415 [Dinoroseobacter sp.]|nr:hypothetical protein [Dinoroseobacter sp.]